MSLSSLYPRSALIRQIQPSAIFQLNQRIQQMNHDGADIIDLTIGEPDFPTPSWIGQAAMDAITRHDTRYPPIAGSVSLRKAVQAWYQDQHDLTYDLDQIVIGNGAKQVLFNALMATLNPGDHVVLPAPYWASYIDMIRCTGATPDVVICPENQGFKITPDQLNQTIRPTTRWVILNSPNNPTGAVYSKEEWHQLGTVLEHHPHVWVLTDEIYDAIRYDHEPPATFLKAAPHLYDRTLIVNGVSKTFAMTGWRVGYGLGPSWLIQEMTKLQSQSTSGVCSIAQAAATAALQEPRSDVLRYVDTYHERRNLLMSALPEIPIFSCTSIPEGAFYAYLNCTPLLHHVPSLYTDQDAAAWILDHARIACVPGMVFGLSPYVRLSYAIPTHRFQQALARLKEASPFSPHELPSL